jgi:hypothetical protein
VLPVGIEPTTSPLPRECSTTELRQRSAYDKSCGRAMLIHEVSGFGNKATAAYCRNCPRMAAFAGRLFRIRGGSAGAPYALASIESGYHFQCTRAQYPPGRTRNRDELLLHSRRWQRGLQQRVTE